MQFKQPLFTSEFNNRIRLLNNLQTGTNGESFLSGNLPKRIWEPKLICITSSAHLKVIFSFKNV